jgi:FeS assembly SUF system protein
MTDHDEIPSSQAAPIPTVHLPVLPHSGKVDQLRREARVEGLAPSPDPAPDAVAPPSAGPSQPSDAMRKKLLEAKVIGALHKIYDPEIPIDIYELGLVYDIEIHDDDSVKVQMTLTAPACPVAGSLPGEVERQIEAIPEVKSAEVVLVWDPPWGRERMSEAALLQLGML